MGSSMSKARVDEETTSRSTVFTFNTNMKKNSTIVTIMKTDESTIKKIIKSLSALPSVSQYLFILFANTTSFQVKPQSKFSIVATKFNNEPCIMISTSLISHTTDSVILDRKNSKFPNILIKIGNDHELADAVYKNDEFILANNLVETVNGSVFNELNASNLLIISAIPSKNVVNTVTSNQNFFVNYATDNLLNAVSHLNTMTSRNNCSTVYNLHTMNHKDISFFNFFISYFSNNNNVNLEKFDNKRFILNFNSCNKKQVTFLGKTLGLENGDTTSDFALDGKSLIKRYSEAGAYFGEFVKGLDAAIELFTNVAPAKFVDNHGYDLVSMKIPETQIKTLVMLSKTTSSIKKFVFVVDFTLPKTLENDLSKNYKVEKIGKTYTYIHNLIKSGDYWKVIPNCGFEVNISQKHVSDVDMNFVEGVVSTKYKRSEVSKAYPIVGTTFKPQDLIYTTVPKIHMPAIDTKNLLIFYSPKAEPITIFQLLSNVRAKGFNKFLFITHTDGRTFEHSKFSIKNISERTFITSDLIYTFNEHKIVVTIDEESYTYAIDKFSTSADVSFNPKNIDNRLTPDNGWYYCIRDPLNNVVEKMTGLDSTIFIVSSYPKLDEYKFNRKMLTSFNSNISTTVILPKFGGGKNLVNGLIGTIRSFYTNNTANLNVILKVDPGVTGSTRFNEQYSYMIFNTNGKTVSDGLDAITFDGKVKVTKNTTRGVDMPELSLINPLEVNIEIGNRYIVSQDTIFENVSGIMLQEPERTITPRLEFNFKPTNLPTIVYVKCTLLELHTLLSEHIEPDMFKDRQVIFVIRLNESFTLVRLYSKVMRRLEQKNILNLQGKEIGNLMFITQKQFGSMDKHIVFGDKQFVHDSPENIKDINIDTVTGAFTSGEQLCEIKTFSNESEAFSYSICKMSQNLDKIKVVSTVDLFGATLPILVYPHMDDFEMDSLIQIINKSKSCKDLFVVSIRNDQLFRSQSFRGVSSMENIYCFYEMSRRVTMIKKENYVRITCTEKKYWFKFGVWTSTDLPPNDFTKTNEIDFLIVKSDKVGVKYSDDFNIILNTRTCLTPEFIRFNGIDDGTLPIVQKYIAAKVPCITFTRNIVVKLDPADVFIVIPNNESKCMFIEFACQVRNIHPNACLIYINKFNAKQPNPQETLRINIDGKCTQIGTNDFLFRDKYIFYPMPTTSAQVVRFSTSHNFIVAFDKDSVDDKLFPHIILNSDETVDAALMGQRLKYPEYPFGNETLNVISFINTNKDSTL